MEKMIDFTAEKIAKICNGRILSGAHDTVITTFERDTKEIQVGDMFVGIKGETHDGSEFFEVAIQNGAIGAIIANVEVSNEILDKYKEKVIIKVEDTVRALQELAKYKRNIYDIPVVAVTGSVGKTSTKDIIANVMAQKYKVLKTSGNLNNHIGLPLTILKLQDHEAMVVEMGMNHFGEISVLTNIAKPNVAVITNIGTAHIGILGSRENILKAKLEILEGLNKNGIIVINNDNDLLHKWQEEAKDTYNIKTCGIKEESTYKAEAIETGINGSTFDVNINNKEYTIKVPIGGEHFVTNSLIALCVGNIFEIAPEDIIKGIETFELTKRRMEIIKAKNGITIINDSYNASFDSVKPAIEYLKAAEGIRKIAILGDMLELGDYAKEIHEKVGMEVAKNNIDILVVVGELAENIANSANKNGIEETRIIRCSNTDIAIEKVKRLVKEGDLILLKASNLMKLYRIAEELQ